MEQSTRPFCTGFSKRLKPGRFIRAWPQGTILSSLDTRHRRRCVHLCPTADLSHSCAANQPSADGTRAPNTNAARCYSCRHRWYRRPFLLSDFGWTLVFRTFCDRSLGMSEWGERRTSKAYLFALATKEVWGKEKVGQEGGVEEDFFWSFHKC